MNRSKVIDMAGRRINEWFVTERAYDVGASTLTNNPPPSSQPQSQSAYVK